MDYTWADGVWLAEHYTSHKQNNVGSGRSADPFEMGFRNGIRKAINDAYQSDNGNRDKRFSERQNSPQMYANSEKIKKQTKIKKAEPKEFIKLNSSLIFENFYEEKHFSFFLKHDAYIDILDSVQYLV